MTKRTLVKLVVCMGVVAICMIAGITKVNALNNDQVPEAVANDVCDEPINDEEEAEEVKDEVAATTEESKKPSTKATTKKSSEKEVVVAETKKNAETSNNEIKISVVENDDVKAETTTVVKTTEKDRAEEAEAAEKAKKEAAEAAAKAEAQAKAEAEAKAEAAKKAEEAQKAEADRIAEEAKQEAESTPTTFAQREVVQRGKWTLVYDSSVEEPYVEGNVKYFPYTMYTGL